MTTLTVGRDPHVDDMIQRLQAMDDRTFRNEVDEDLRRPGPSQRRSYETRRAALRSPELVDRWNTTLQQITKSVEGQLASKQEDYEAARAALRREANKLTPGSPEWLKNKDEQEALKVEYATERAGKLRFKTGLDEWVVEARALRDAHRATMYDSIVAEERNHYAEELRRLKEAIETHRSQILHDEDYEPSSADERLWSCLK